MVALYRGGRRRRLFRRTERHGCSWRMSWGSTRARSSSGSRRQSSSRTRPCSCPSDALPTTGRARRLAVAAALALAAGTLLALGSGGPRAGEPPAETMLAHASDVAVIEPDSSKVVARVPVGSPCPDPGGDDAPCGWRTSST